MNKDMIFGLIRHAVTVISGGILAGKSESIDTLFSTLFTNITGGDWQTILATVATLSAMLWSVWVKATESTKETVIKTLTFSKGK